MTRPCHPFIMDLSHGQFVVALFGFKSAWPKRNRTHRGQGLLPNHLITSLVLQQLTDSHTHWNQKERGGNEHVPDV